MGGGLLSLSLSLSRCSHFLARLWAKFKGLFYSFYRSFNSSYSKFFLFHRSFNSSFCLQKAFFRALCFFEIFKCFVFGLLRPFCHFEPFTKRRKIQRIESTFAILGYFACAQYDKFGLLFKNNGYFHSNFEAKIQIFYSKFKAFHKFNSFCKFKAFYKFKSFHNFISNFKPYTRLLHIFTPSFRSVQTDKKFFTRRTLCLNRNL